jgi:hypothetical protein
MDEPKSPDNPTAEAETAVQQAINDDLASPPSNVGVDDDVDDDAASADDQKAHSFRQRRLTYSRHHILSDDAARAVAELLAGHDAASEGGVDGDGSGNEEKGDGVELNTAEQVGKDEEGTVAVSGKKDGAAAAKSAEDSISGSSGDVGVKRKLKSTTDNSAHEEPPANKQKQQQVNQQQPQSVPYLPSRILHAGEIVRRNSPSNNNLHSSPDVRTGLYSHPTQHHHHQQHDDITGVVSHNQHHHRNKWRQRFSFCSTTPDHHLPFPRDIVGTYSCHGMEPVYDSDYEDSDYEEEEDGDDIAASNNNINGGGATTVKSNQQTTAKINQDRGGITYPFANSSTTALFSVYDGHGDGGELVSQYALGEVARLLEGRLLSELLNGGSGGKSGGRCGLMRIDEDGGATADDEGSTTDAAFGGEEEEDMIKQAFRDTFVKVDRGLLDEADIEVSVF